MFLRKPLYAVSFLYFFIAVSWVTNSFSMQIKSVTPTIFFAEINGELFQAVDIIIENVDMPNEIHLKYEIDLNRGHTVLGSLERQNGKYRLFVPDVRRLSEAKFTLVRNELVIDRKVIQWKPKKHWHVYLEPLAHHDYGYTKPIEEILEIYRGYYEDILLYCRETDSFPFESKFRYTVEESWSILDFIRNCTPELQKDLVRRMKEGRIEITALMGNEITNLCGHEELIRFLYPSFSFKERYGISIRSSSITDVPGLSWGLPTVLAGAGVRYFFAGLPTYFSWGGRNLHNFWDESAVMPQGIPDAFLWEGPDGSQVLVYYQKGYGNWTPLSCDDVLKSLPGKLEPLDKRGHPYDAVRYGFNCGDNRPPNVSCSYLSREWNKRWAYPKLIVGTKSMFFEHLEKYRLNLRVYRGEIPDTDYVVGATSSARETGINRITHDRLVSAEKLAAAASFFGAEYPAKRIRKAWEDMLLYDEHTWGMSNPLGEVQDWNWSDKSGHAYRAAGLARSILTISSDKIAEMISLPDDGMYIVVFNPLSFERKTCVKTVHEYSRRSFWGSNSIHAKAPFDLIDAETGEMVVHQTVRIDDPQSPIPYASYRYAMGHVDSSFFYELSFTTDNIPPMGYKTYKVVPRESRSVQENLITGEDTIIENRFFKVVIDTETGSAARIFDKELGKELADEQADYGINQLIVRSVKTGEVWSADDITIRRGEAGPVYESIIIKGKCHGIPQVTQEVILYKDIKRIDFANRILKDSSPFQEVFFAFPFDIDNPEFRFEGTNSVIEPIKDQFPGSNTDYYAVQHWVDINNGEFGVTFSGVESHIVELGGLYPGYVSQAHHALDQPNFEHEFLKELPPKAHIYSLVLINNFRTNFQPVQHGELLFRYSITSHEGNHLKGKARDFGWDVHNPVISVITKGERKGILPLSASFCEINAQNVLLTALKQAENCNGYIVRLIETEGKEKTVTVNLPFIKIESAYRTNIVEENEELLSTGEHTFAVSVKPFGITTVRVVSF